MPLILMFYCWGRALFAFSLIASVALGLTGCENTGAHSIETREPMTAEEVTAFIQEWQQVKPQINELTALKKDLAIILAEVNRQSDLANLPQQYAEQRQVDYVEAEEDDFFFDETFQSDTAVPEQKVDSSSDELSESGTPVPSEGDEGLSERQLYAAHLAYFMSLQTAQQGWTRIIRQFPALAQAVEVKVFAEQQGEQILYSLRVGPFATSMATQRVCQVFKTLNFQCRSVVFDGDNINVSSSSATSAN